MANVKGAAIAKANTTGGTDAFGSQAPYQIGGTGQWYSPNGTPISDAEAYAQKAQVSQQEAGDQAAINTYNAATPDGLTSLFTSAGREIVPAAIGYLTGGPIGAAVGGYAGFQKNLSADAAAQNQVNTAQRQAYDSAVSPAAQVYAAKAGGAGAGGSSLGTTSSPLTATNPQAGITPEIQAMLNSYQNRQAPTVNAASLSPAAQAQTAQIGPLATASAQQAAAERAQASAAGATSIDPAAMAAAQRAAAERSGYTNLDLTQSNATRAQQQGSIADLIAASRGQVPSAAEIQLHQATDRNVSNQLALAAALQGRSPGGALKQASDATGAINAQAAGDAAALRANEQANARNALSQALSGVRGQDIGTAETQAGLTQGVNLANAQLGTSVNQSNAALGTQTNLSNAAALNARAQAQAQLQQQRLLENAQLATAVSQSNASLGTQANLQNAQLGTQTNMFNAGQTNTAAIDQAQLGQQANLFNTGQTNTFAQQQATMQQQAALANADNQLKAMGLDDEQRARFLQALVTSKGQDLGFTTDTQRNAIAQQLGLGGLDVQRQQLALAASQQTWNQAKDVLGAVGTGAAAVGSSDWFKSLMSGSSPNSSTAPYDANWGDLNGNGGITPDYSSWTTDYGTNFGDV